MIAYANPVVQLCYLYVDKADSANPYKASLDVVVFCCWPVSLSSLSLCLTQPMSMSVGLQLQAIYGHDYPWSVSFCVLVGNPSVSMGDLLSLQSSLELSTLTFPLSTFPFSRVGPSSFHPVAMSAVFARSNEAVVESLFLCLS